MSGQTKKFKTEVQQLLDLMIHSLYSNKDIFLRELIANAADAIDKARFESLTNPDIAADWAIRIKPDKDKGLLVISDNGVGMTRQEVTDNIGTIAKSGTKAFLQAMEERKVAESPDLIGQFGVGFYSSFMVADKVELETRRAGSDGSATRWESDGKGSYKIDDSDRTAQGTTITVHLKDDFKEYLDEWKIKSIIKKYSDFIEHPIVMPVSKPVETDGDDEGDGEPAEIIEDEVLNSRQAIWLRNPSEVSDDEYNSFFSHLNHFEAEPLRRIHFAAEGTSEFKSLLFIPAKAPFDLFFPEKKTHLHLYVRRVFITDDCPGLLPAYMRFIKGVVDSNDLPLNISRELLQDNPLIGKISKNLVRKIIGELKKVMESEPGKYAEFFSEFGRVLKEGVHMDFENRDKLRGLLMFETMNNEPGKLVSLEEYAAAMPESQKNIYYIIGENRGTLENSPHLEFLKSKGFDILFMTDPIDEWVVQSVRDFDGRQLQAVGKGDIDIEAEDKERIERAAEENKNLLEAIKKQLEGKIKDVRFSKRLTESPCCLVGEDYEPSPYMQRIYKAMNHETPNVKRVLELNPNHPIVDSLGQLHDKDPESLELAEYAEMLFDQALLTEGSPIPDPLAFSKRVAKLMVASLGG